MSRNNNDDYVRVPLPDNIEIADESDPEIDGLTEANTNENQAPNLWNFVFYQQLFDVDTLQVLRRLAFSVLPNPRSNFTQKVLKPRADLYGPFWIATTLILAAAVGGNVSSFLKSRGQVTTWRYDFGKVTLASTVIYMYWWFVPLAIVALSYIRSKRSATSQSEGDQEPLMEPGRRMHRHMGSLEKSGFVELLSLYGYSMAIFVPVSILWTIPSAILQWLLVIIAMAISGAFLTFSLFPMFKREHKQIAGLLVISVIILHCLFSIGLMMTFFYGSGTPTTAVSPVIPNQNQEVVNSMNQKPVANVGETPDQLPQAKVAHESNMNQREKT